MRKLWFRRRAVSTMIGGMIVLGLFLSAIAAMILLSYEFDSYQTTVNKMQQADSERFAENIQPTPPAVSPGEAFSIPCAGSQTCNNYTMTLTNLGIGLQIARIYINSSKSPGCTSICVLDPSTSASPSSFRAADRYINPSESKSISLWLPGNPSPGANITLPADEFGLNTIMIVTTRGRVFAFQWPLPPPGPGAGGVGGGGGTGLYIGPLVIIFQKQLIAYTYNNTGRVNFPIGGTNGHWSIPRQKLVFYIKIQTDVGTPNDVYLTAHSVFELTQYDNTGGPGHVVSLFIIAPLDVDFCLNGFAPKDSSIRCDPAYGYYLGGTNGDPDQMGGNRIIPYRPCNVPPDQYNSLNCASQGPRYLIPKPTSQQLFNGQRGNPVIVAFAAKSAGSDQTNPDWGGFEPDDSATSFLGMTYIYNNGVVGFYTYAVTLPFIALCVRDPASNPGQCSG